MVWFVPGSTSGYSIYTPTCSTTSTYPIGFNIISQTATASTIMPSLVWIDGMRMTDWPMYLDSQRRQYWVDPLQANPSFAPPDWISPIAPAIQPSAADLLARDQERFQRAVAEHDYQEARRIDGIITARQQEIDARQALQDARRREEDERRVLQQARGQRAEQLLLEHLTPEQRETYVRNNWFIVEGGRSKIKYRINTRAIAGNIEVLEPASILHSERVSARLCCHVAYQADVPHHDHLLAQKIMLELAEEDFLRTANRTNIR